MNSNKNFLQKIFTVTTVFLCAVHHNSFGTPSTTVLTQTTSQTTVTTTNTNSFNYNFVSTVPADRFLNLTTTSDVKKAVENTYCQSGSATNATKITLCPEGQYVYACGNYITGISWLKGLNITNANSVAVTTPNYFDKSDTLTNLNNLRLFFDTGNDAGITYNENGELVNISKQQIQEARKTILVNVCNVVDSSIQITCAACPNNGTVDESSVYVDNDKMFCDKYEFHTIADCHIDSFNDSTGTYSYKTVTGEVGDGIVGCHYSDTDNINGSELNNRTPKTVTTGQVVTPKKSTDVIQQFKNNSLKGQTAFSVQ